MSLCEPILGDSSMLSLHILGAGTPKPSSKRFGTCYILKTKEDYLMFDCGPAATYKMAIMGLNPTEINILFFSHHHFDHNSDYPCFLLSRWDQASGKGKELKVYGPPPTKQLTDRLIGKDGAFFPDWQARIEHKGSQEIFQKRGGVLPRRPPTVHVKEIDTGRCIEGEDWQITTIRVRHIDPWMPTLAYRFENEDKSIVFTSDCGFCQSIIDFSKGADYLLIHCWDVQNKMGVFEKAMIAGTVDAGIIADKAGVRNLLISHINPSLDLQKNQNNVIKDIRKNFRGKIEFAKELSTIEI